MHERVRRSGRPSVSRINKALKGTTDLPPLLPTIIILPFLHYLLLPLAKPEEGICNKMSAVRLSGILGGEDADKYIDGRFVSNVCIFLEAWQVIPEGAMFTP